METQRIDSPASRRFGALGSAAWLLCAMGCSTTIHENEPLYDTAGQQNATAPSAMSPRAPQDVDKPEDKTQTPWKPGLYVSPLGSGLRDGSSASNAMSFDEAQVLSATEVSTPLQFWMLTGAYGAFVESPAVARTAWHTFKAAPGQTPVFDSIVITGTEGDQVANYLRFQGGDYPIEVYGEGIVLGWVRHLDFDGLEIHGDVTEPFGDWEMNCERYLSNAAGFHTTEAVTDLRLANSEIYDLRYGATGKGSNTVFENNLLRDLGEEAFHLPWGQSADLGDQSHFVLEANEVYHVGDCFHSFDPTPHPDVVQVFLSFDPQHAKVSDIQILDNYFHDIGNAQGIFISPGADGLVSDVLVEGNVISGILSPLQHYMYTKIDGLTVRHNTGGSQRFLGDVSNVIQEYNLSHGNIYYQTGAHILTFEHHITNGWMDPTQHATGPTCKGEVTMGSSGSAPLCIQPSSAHCDVNQWEQTVGALPCVTK